MENKMINQWDYILIFTSGHHILWAEDPHNMDVEDAVAELQASGENLYEDRTERDHPTPAALLWYFTIITWILMYLLSPRGSNAV